MRRSLKIPRIIKIEKIEGFKIYCMFNNGETRLLDFKSIFRKWNITENDVEYKLLDKKEFEKVKLHNFNLTWENIQISLLSDEGEEKTFPYEISPDVLFELSTVTEMSFSEKMGTIIRKARKEAGLTQEQLAIRSGTTRFYISRIENNKTDVELSTIRKIVEAGLDKHFRLMIE